MVEKFLLNISSLNLNDSITLLKYYMNEWKIDMPKTASSKDFFLEIEEELDSSVIEIRYQALSKLLLSFIQLPNDNEYSFFDEQIEDYFNKANINDSFEYGMLPELIHNLFYFYSQFLKLPNDTVTIKKCELIFFIKINSYLLFLMLFLLRLKKDMKSYIKINGDEIEEISLKFIKISNSYKYTPARIFLCLHYTYFMILTSNENEETVENHTCRKIEKNKNYLTKQNYMKYLKQKVPLVFTSMSSSTTNINLVEKFYRRNMLKRDKPELERVIIVQILKILLAICDYSKNPQSLTISECIKDFMSELILKKVFIDKIVPKFVEKEEKEQDDLNKEIAYKNIDDLEGDLSEEEIGHYSIIDIMNKLSITTIIISFYLKVLKTLQNNNLIQYAYFIFHLKDSNGLFVFLKILKQDNLQIEQTFVTNYGRENIINLFNELTELTLLNNLKLIYKISFKNNEYILKLIDCKVPIMLKKILVNFEKNEKIKKCCLKLFKCQIKFFDKNWRTENINIITSIYLTLKVGCTEEDNYLERKDKNVSEINSVYFNEEELKKLFQEFHETNYLFYLNNPKEFEKYQNEQHMSLYAKLYLKMKKIADEQFSKQISEK